jgi:hypothetical protein
MIALYLQTLILSCVKGACMQRQSRRTAGRNMHKQSHASKLHRTCSISTKYSTICAVRTQSNKPLSSAATESSQGERTPYKQPTYTQTEPLYNLHTIPPSNQEDLDKLHNLPPASQTHLPPVLCTHLPNSLVQGSVNSPASQIYFPFGLENQSQPQTRENIINTCIIA